MSDNAPFKIALLGLGNLMRTDDAVGMLTLQTLAGSNLLAA
jgi:Ni,Fe-hydrogenase maturation factor